MEKPNRHTGSSLRHLDTILHKTFYEVNHVIQYTFDSKIYIYQKHISKKLFIFLTSSLFTMWIEKWINYLYIICNYLKKWIFAFFENVWKLVLNKAYQNSQISYQIWLSNPLDKGCLLFSRQILRFHCTTSYSTL